MAAQFNKTNLTAGAAANDGGHMLNLGLSGTRQKNGVFWLRGGCNGSWRSYGTERRSLSQVKEELEFEILRGDEIPGLLAVSHLR